MSYSYPVTGAVVDAVYYRFTANDEGFNETFNRLAPNYGVPATMAIMFAPGSNAASPNFAKANVDPEVWLTSSATSFPFMTLFGNGIRNTNETKFHQFSGAVEIGVNVFLSWPTGRVLQDFTSLAACVEETMLTLFNRARNANPDDQDWDFPGENVDVVYNGDIYMTPSRVERGEESWKQLLAFRASFRVDAKGEV